MLDDPKAFGRDLRQRVEDLVAKAVDAAMTKWVESVPDFIKRAASDEAEVRFRDLRADVEVEKRIEQKWRTETTEALEKLASRQPDPDKLETLLVEVETATDRFDKRRSELAQETAALRKMQDSMVVTAADLRNALEHAEWLLGAMTKGLREAGTELEGRADKAARAAVAELATNAKVEIAKALGDDQDRIPVRGFLGPFAKGMKARRGDVAVWHGASYIAARETEEAPGRHGPDAPWRMMQPPMGMAP